MLTYRQLHAKKIGPQHPLRVIAHCDVVCYSIVRLRLDQPHADHPPKSNSNGAAIGRPGANFYSPGVHFALQRSCGTTLGILPGALKLAIGC
ncbi:hypothetical protein PGT21_016038 [Puccinia graminis f. sp. tritici]|uniref:Uncharacterized protein n=1 Tax=Puccinia graminis f. sp. tritici TaxID=56615 RepID=A0A5B0LTP2_PUCGR|nr:hypothetical protein PGT21_016038 [Puccinia graminis f. sp. tritici]KAA1093510.1 hypothetical protein PGTUg99_023968 [Puccinia graminis f. sp. tritici]